MGIEIKKKWNGDLSVETDYGAGFVEHKTVYENRNEIKKYMNDFNKDSITATDYSGIRDKMNEDYSRRKEEEKKRYDEWAEEAYRSNKY